MRAGAVLAAVAFALGGCGPAPDAPTKAEADAAREAPADGDTGSDAFKLVADAPTEQVDFDGDGTPETVSIVTFGAGDTKAVHFDDPWARSTGAKPEPPKAGDKLMLIRGARIGTWALSNAAHNVQRALLPGLIPLEFQDCWKEARGAIFSGGESGGGVIAWKADKFEWSQCGD